MESYTPLTATQARSLVRRRWTEKEYTKYRELFGLVEQVIEDSARNGNLSVSFQFEKNGSITQARMLAAELQSEGYGVKLLYLGHRDITQGSQTDFKVDKLKIYWGMGLDD